MQKKGTPFLTSLFLIKDIFYYSVEAFLAE